MPLTCTGGDFATGNLIDIPSGTYSSITVKGACDVPADAVIHVIGNVIVRPGAFLDAQSAPSTIIVGHDVYAAPNAFVGLGCQPTSYTGNSAHPCMVEPDGHSTITVKGSIRAWDAALFLLNGVKVKGNVTMLGGGNEMIPWSIKNNTIRGNLTVGGQTTEWLGVLFNHVGKNVRLFDITVNDPGDPAPTMFIVENTIGHNLYCTGLAPAVSGGFFPGEVNTVGGHTFGQCKNLPSG